MFPALGERAMDDRKMTGLPLVSWWIGSVFGSWLFALLIVWAFLTVFAW